MAQAAGRKARAMTTLSDVPQGTVPARVRPNGPLMLRVKLPPAGALRLQGPRARVGRVPPEEPDVGRLSKVALILLKAIPPAALLGLCLDYRVEADPGSWVSGRDPTGGGEPITATSPHRRSGTPLSRAV